MIKLIEVYSAYKYQVRAELEINGKRKRGYKMGDTINGYTITAIITERSYMKAFIEFDEQYKLHLNENLIMAKLAK
jgi:hypothetical protein